MHVAAATVGLSALIASSATAFTVVKLVGAAYLIVVGIRRILAGDERRAGAARAPRAAAAALPPGRRRQRAQPEDRAVLPRVPAAVRRPASAARSALQVAVLGAALRVDRTALRPDATPCSPTRSPDASGAPARARASAATLTGGIFVALGDHRAAAAPAASDVTRIPLLSDSRIVVAEPGDGRRRAPAAARRARRSQDVGAAVRDALALSARRRAARASS